MTDDELRKQLEARGMTLCPDCDPFIGPVCDFCRHYNFNGNETGAYTGDGFCCLRQKPMEPEGGCDQFHCNGVILEADHD